MRTQLWIDDLRFTAGRSIADLNALDPSPPSAHQERGISFDGHAEGQSYFSGRTWGAPSSDLGDPGHLDHADRRMVAQPATPRMQHFGNQVFAQRRLPWASTGATTSRPRASRGGGPTAGVGIAAALPIDPGNARSSGSTTVGFALIKGGSRRLGESRSGLAGRVRQFSRLKYTPPGYGQLSETGTGRPYKTSSGLRGEGRPGRPGRERDRPALS